MNVVINGKNKTISGNNIPELCQELGVPIKNVIFEVNGEIVYKTAYEEFSLSENDTIEIVQFVGGGA